MLKVSAPGKLMIAGEWAVLELGNPCIVAAVDKRVYSEIKPSEKIVVTIPEFGIKNAEGAFASDKFSWKGKADEEKLIFTKSAIETALKFLGKSRPFDLVSYGKDTQIKTEKGLKKIGFGSSAAAVVSNISAILKFNGIGISKKESKDIIYKLSALAHYYAQGKLGSAFDIAASTYGGVIIYKRFDADWLTKKIENGSSVKNLVEMGWPGFYVEELQIPNNLNLDIFWTGESASTSAMIKQMNEFKKKYKKSYNEKYSEIKTIVEQIIENWKIKNFEEIIPLLVKNEEVLRELTKESGVNIETKELKLLSDTAKQFGAAGKLSGAGGGDCGIVISFDKYISKKVKADIVKQNFILVDAKIDNDGVKAEKSVISNAQ